MALANAIPEPCQRLTGSSGYDWRPGSGGGCDALRGERLIAGRLEAMMSKGTSMKKEKKKPKKKA
jgi:hypothetical protein